MGVPELLFFGLFMVALVIGWFLGRREAIKVGVMLRPDGSALDKQYFIGLNYLLNEQPDEAIETFIRALEVNPETVETHIAIGKLFRQRGDVERAIKVHQNLLARPSLSRGQGDRVQFELAQDYLAVGLDPRARKLLDELITTRSPMRAEALAALVRIHEREQDWQSAQIVGRKLADEQPEFVKTLAHYYCELAREAHGKKDWPGVRQHLQQALAADASSVRAMLKIASFEDEQGRSREVVKWLDRLADRAPDFVPQALPLIRRYADNGELDLPIYLDRVIANSSPPLIDTVLARAEYVKNSVGMQDASRYVVSQIQLHPSLRGLIYLIDLHKDRVDPKGQKNLEMLRAVVQRLAEDALHYRCGACGFAGKHLYWQCPTCHRWSTIRPLKGREAG